MLTFSNLLNNKIRCHPVMKDVVQFDAILFLELNINLLSTVYTGLVKITHLPKIQYREGREDVTVFRRLNT
jgi:hypothetical protein